MKELELKKKDIEIEILPWIDDTKDNLNNLKIKISLSRLGDQYDFTLNRKDNTLYRELVIIDQINNSTIGSGVIFQSLYKEEDLEDFYNRHDQLFSKIRLLLKGDIKTKFNFACAKGWIKLFLNDDNKDFNDTIGFIEYLKKEFQHL